MFKHAFPEERVEITEQLLGVDPGVGGVQRVVDVCLQYVDHVTDVNLQRRCALKHLSS